MADNVNFIIPTLGKAKIKSPIKLSKDNADFISNYVTDDKFVLHDVFATPGKIVSYNAETLLEIAGPREFIFFDPGKVNAGIVTCGGLCPGLNDVIRSVVMTLWYQYGVRKICGIGYGYRGFIPEFATPVKELNPDVVSDIHKTGGTILGSSRGYGDEIEKIVDSIEQLNLKILFTIGGDGTQKGALRIAEEALKRGLKLSVVGIPKTIDNDLSYIQKSFGFETAVSHAVNAISASHMEAKGAFNGIGMVKVMGRESGFIAAHTTLGQNDVNFVLIPEVRFDLDGENGLLVHLKKRIERRNHAVILVAEGAGQNLLEHSTNVDASGNKLLADIGVFLKNKITEYFKKINFEANVKYIDPSYMIRCAPANTSDSIFCTRLGAHAVHAAMTGRTKMLVSLVNEQFVHLPIEMAVSRRNCIDTEGPLWRDVIEATGQPYIMHN
ncbi:MAG: hypothetical protein ACD_79C00488G0002 [uncultured bacterium]|nr:MAG: hypothetical protein ACD_79C00488G0002 [uncultured bacterium]